MTGSKYLIALVILIGLSTLFTVRAQAAKNSPMPMAGSAAPDFTLISQDGKPVSLHDFHGHWVVLYFYPKDFTSGCTIEAHNFQKDIQLYDARNAAIIGVSVDNANSHKNFCTRQGLNFKLLADTNYIASSLYDSLHRLGPLSFSARNTFIIDPHGKVAKVFTGVQPTKHSQEVLAALDTLQKKPK